jgi:hypothetical protein
MILVAKAINGGIAYGSVAGAKALRALQKVSGDYPDNMTIEMSFLGVEQMDSTYAKESIIAIVRLNWGKKWFCFTDIEHQDILFNIDYACKDADVSIVAVCKSGYDILGPEQTVEEQYILDFIMKKGQVTTKILAKNEGISSQNASLKLRRLKDKGLIIPEIRSADTGGFEYLYYAVR